MQLEKFFFDADRGTLRLYTANQAENIILADRAWVTANTFSGDYNSLTNIPPSAVTDVNQLADSSNLFFDRDYNSLDNLPNLDDLVTDISTIGVIGDVNISGVPENGQLLVWDGSIWVNQTVEGFADTNTTYDVSAGATAAGVEVLLTDDQAVSTTVQFNQGTGIGLAITDTNQITITNDATYAVDDLSNVTAASPSEGDTLIYTSGSWINSPPTGGLNADDISVTTEAESGGGSLSYNEGTFTFAPADLSVAIQLDSLSVTTDTAQAGGALTYNSSDGTFTFRPANLSGYAQLTQFSVTTDGTPSGGGSLSYNDSSGEFTFVPADTAGGGGGDVVDDTTPELGGDLDLNNYNIVGTGDINITGSVSATDFSSGAVGAPQITSASTITLTAPDGIINNGLVDLKATREALEYIANPIGTTTCNLDNAAVFWMNNLQGAVAANFTNVPTDVNKVITVAVVCQQGATGYIPTVQIDGVAQTINWQGGSAPTGNANDIDVVSFTFATYSAGFWTVLGSMTSYT